MRKRIQVRRPRRPLEAQSEDFVRWDAAAAAAGLNWSEFTRRVLDKAANDAHRPAKTAARRKGS